MKKSILALMLILSIKSMAQTSMLYSYGDNHAKYSVTKIVDKGDSYQLLKVTTVSKSIFQSHKWEWMVKLLESNQLNELNEFSVQEFNKTTNERVSFKDFWVLPTESSVKSESVTTNTPEELSQLYPELVKMQGDDIIRYEDKRVKTYSFDPYYQQYFESDNKLITCSHPSRTDKMAARGIYTNGFDVMNNEALTVYYADKSKDDKWASFKNIEVITTNINCDVVNQYKASFEYPRNFEKFIPVTDIADPKVSKGNLLLFDRVNAGKLGDPDKAVVQVVYCGEDGSSINATLKFRDDNKGWEKIHGAFSDGEKVYISYHSYGAQGYTFGIKELDGSGNVTDHTFTKEQLLSNSNQITKNEKVLIDSRKSLGTLAGDAGLKWGIEEFNMQGAQKIGDDLYIWGQMAYKTADPNYKGEGLAPSVLNYAEGLIFVYNKDFEFKNLNIIDLPGSKRIKEFSIIGNSNNELEFFIPVESSDKKDYDKTILTKGEKTGDRLPGYYNSLTSPLFVTINKEGCKYKYFNDIYGLNLVQGFENSKDGKRYVVGFEAEAGVYRDDTGEDIYGNRHYILINELTY